MFEYMTVQQAADKWKLSQRRVQKLCAENRIMGAMRVSRVWLIPNQAKKPMDARRKSTDNPMGNDKSKGVYHEDISD